MLHRITRIIANRLHCLMRFLVDYYRPQQIRRRPAVAGANYRQAEE